ncbi:MAG TPA: cobyric acid synthase, partial [Deltaproteobacteria bacterium]|nr:cobyric acid synthase [Deltaproteobacteria bacterium]
LPHISNFTDFDPLSDFDQVKLYFIEKVQDLSLFAAVILPGSKNTRFDLNWIKESGWSDELKACHARGGHILGVCGGYQMLGFSVHDEDGIEGEPGETGGLSLLPVETYLKAPKTTTITRFMWEGHPGRGYEIHMGHTHRSSGSAIFDITERNGAACVDLDGSVSDDGRVMGTYIHGIFDTPDILYQWLTQIGLENISIPKVAGPAARERDYDLLAEHFEKHIDVEGILKKMNVQHRTSNIECLMGKDEQ